MERAGVGEGEGERKREKGVEGTQSPLSTAAPAGA